MTDPPACPDRQALTEVVNTTAEMASMMPPQPYRDEAQINNILKCPDCQEDPPNLIEEFSSGDMVCASCGLVVSDLIDVAKKNKTKIRPTRVKLLSFR